MRVRGRRRKSVAFFIVLGSCLVALAVALNVGWILLNWREVALLVFGIIFFSLIITGVVLNTIFLIREIRRNEQHDAFINAVSHELKTPIASIRLYLETLKTRTVDEERRKEFYDVMLADSDRLIHTVDQVLQAGRAAAQRRQQTTTALIDFSDLVRECLDLTRRRYNLGDEALDYSETLNGERACITGDPEEIRAAVSNLLDNAVKYSDKEVKVSVNLAAPNKNIVLRIVDSGVGIQAGQLKRIFKRFYRVPGRVMGRFKGTGLGLFIVRSIVKKHGGRVFAESEGLGQGSTFTIELPRT
ncbi:MAG TPA: HAMP domain-containing sensor histidine kinase [Pyrinomonadaceae bacterium]|jgi:signal transduction histidine kinase|nr:HAMP domain-containing sensor histidine kinase [Pyrinomonadaceae bacterium]